MTEETTGAVEEISKRRDTETFKVSDLMFKVGACNASLFLFTLQSPF